MECPSYLWVSAELMECPSYLWVSAELMECPSYLWVSAELMECPSYLNGSVLNFPNTSFVKFFSMFLVMLNTLSVGGFLLNLPPFSTPITTSTSCLFTEDSGLSPTYPVPTLITRGKVLALMISSTVPNVIVPCS